MMFERAKGPGEYIKIRTGFEIMCPDCQRKTFILYEVADTCRHKNFICPKCNQIYTMSYVGEGPSGITKWEEKLLEDGICVRRKWGKETKELIREDLPKIVKEMFKAGMLLKKDEEILWWCPSTLRLPKNEDGTYTFFGKMLLTI